MGQQGSTATHAVPFQATVSLSSGVFTTLNPDPAPPVMVAVTAPPVLVTVTPEPTKLMLVS